VEGAREPQVLVVGAGPVGLLLACELARRDVPIRVIDKLARPTTQSRAVVVHARSLEMLERVGVVDELIDAGVAIRGFQITADGKQLAQLSFEGVDSPYPVTISLPQTETERILAVRLAELGVTIDRDLELVGLEQDEASVRSRVRHGDGREETIESAWIAGTDGSHSGVREALGARLEGAFKGERFLLADLEADYELDRTMLHTFFPAGMGTLMLFPMRGDRVRLMAELDEEDAHRGEPTLERVQAIADERAGGIVAREAHWLTIFEIHHAQVPAYRHGRAFLAGDAAHVHSPAGGQGMNTGMQDAFNLGWKLTLASRGEAGPELLDSYHAERHPVAARVIEQSTRLTRAVTIGNAPVRALRGHVMHAVCGVPRVRSRIAAQTEETDIAYRESPIAIERGARHRGPRAGEAAPDVDGRADRPALHWVLARATGHCVLSIGGTDGARELATRWPAAGGEPLHHVLVGEAEDAQPFAAVLDDPEGAVARRYAVGPEGALLVIRPDGYIGLRAAAGDAEAFGAYLGNAFGRA
jgi:2-polyprenyl-6-methoxyphenol hydroxylase-like FAD-dependent oxidoreductase